MGKTQQTFSALRHLIVCAARKRLRRFQSRIEEFTMSQDPRNENNCEICQQSFDSEPELQSHQNGAHGESDSGDRQSNYDIEQDQPNKRKIA
jgi:hypothetical protein